jgi:phytoene synthase
MSSLSYPADQVRRYDYDRFLTAIFAPPAKREPLFALYAFNLEIAKISEVVSEPLIGRMRLQWWRDALDRLDAGLDIAHQVARPLGAAIGAFDLPRTALDSLIDAREYDLERQPPADMTALLAYAEGTGAPLLELALRITRPPGAPTGPLVELARLVGTAWALVGLLRAAPFHARQRRLYLPDDLMSAAKVSAGQLFALKPAPGLASVVRFIAEQAARFLDQTLPLIGAVPRSGRSPLLLTPLARIYLSDLRQVEWDAFALERRPSRNLLAARLAVHAMTGRL